MGGSGQEAYREDREEQEAEVGVEGDQLADGETSAHYLQPAEEHDDQGPDVREEEDEREVVREGADGLEVLAEKLVVD